MNVFQRCCWFVFLSALVGKVLSREDTAEWARFSLAVQNVYKRSPRGDTPLRRGNTSLWVRQADLICKCPKLKPGRSYLILGRESDNADRRAGLAVGRKSIVIEWRGDEWHRRMRRFQHRARQCNNNNNNSNNNNNNN